MVEILEAPVGILEKRLGCSTSQSAGFEEGLLLLLVFGDELRYQRHLFVRETTVLLQILLDLGNFLVEFVQKLVTLPSRRPWMSWWQPSRR